MTRLVIDTAYLALTTLHADALVTRDEEFTAAAATLLRTVTLDDLAT